MWDSLADTVPKRSDFSCDWSMSRAYARSPLKIKRTLVIGDRMNISNRSGQPVTMPTMGWFRWPPCRRWAGSGGRHADDGLVEGHRPGGAVEGGVAEGEETAVGRHLPVATAVRRRRDAHDRLVERLATHGAVELGVAEGEETAVGRHLPVATAVRRRRDAHDRLAERPATHGAVEPGV